MKLLMVCTTCPVPPFSGAALREIGWLRTTAGFADVALTTLTRNDLEHAALSSLTGFCSMVHGVPAPRSAARKLMDLCRAHLTGTPYLVRSGHERRLHEVVRDVIEEWSPDIVQAELLPAAPYLKIARSRAIPTVYAAHNVESRIVAGPAGRRRAGRTARRMHRFEAGMAAEASAVVAVSRIEEAWFRRHTPRVHHVPNAVDPDESPFVPPSQRQGGNLLFVGHLRYGPNVDAATILARQVYPEIRKALPETGCVIAGTNPTRAVRALAGYGVEVVPDPPDLDPLWLGAGALVCPLRWGAGSRIKILQAAARGVPVVSTPLGAEGLEFEPDVHYAVGKDPSQLVDATLSLLRDAGIADQMARAARLAVERHHAWPRLRSAMMELYEGLVGDHRQE